MPNKIREEKITLLKHGKVPHAIIKEYAGKKMLKIDHKFVQICM